MTNQPDLRTMRRGAAATCAVLGPVLMTVVLATYPPLVDQHAPATLAAFRHHLGSGRIELTAGFLASFLMVPFVLAVYRLTSRRAPMAAAVGGVLGLIGWGAFAFQMAADTLAYELARRGGTPSVYASFTHSAGINAVTDVFILGHVVGTVALGVALWRSRTVPVPVAAAFIVAPVVHLVATGAKIRAVDVLSFVVLAVAAAFAAGAILRTPNDAWDVAPVLKAAVPVAA